MDLDLDLGKTCIYGWNLTTCFKHSLMTFLTWTLSCILGLMLTMCFKHLLMSCLVFGLCESFVGLYSQLWTFSVLCPKMWSISALPLLTCFKHSLMTCCFYGSVCYHRPHPSSILLGSGYTSDDTGDGPPPPLRLWPTHHRSSTAPAWNAIQIDFRRFDGDMIRKILLQFRIKSISHLCEVHEFIPL